MDQQERELLAQEFGAWIECASKEQTKHLIEAMECSCKRTWEDSEGRPIVITLGDHVNTHDIMDIKEVKDECKRCLKLKELNK